MLDERDVPESQVAKIFLKTYSHGDRPHLPATNDYYPVKNLRLSTFTPSKEIKICQPGPNLETRCSLIFPSVF